MSFNIFKSVFLAIRKMKPHKAFTLAEVLITLGIIGVVAAITMPTLVTNCQKAIAKVRIKKTCATLAQTTAMAEAEHGHVSTWELGRDHDWSVAQGFSEDYIIPYLRVGFRCKKGNNEKNCNYKMYTLNGQDAKNKISKSETYRFYLVDGTFVMVYAFNEEYKENPQKHYKKALVFFDINGSKGANKFGKDIFKLEYIIKSATKPPEKIGKLAPAWIDEERADLLTGNGGRFAELKCSDEACGKNKQGDACLALFYKDGWKFAPDYPW